MTWIEDHCGERLPMYMTERRARGILAIHQTCEPPCTRASAARRYLSIDSPTIPIAAPAVAYMQSKIDGTWTAVGPDGKPRRIEVDELPEWLHKVFPALAGSEGNTE